MPLHQRLYRSLLQHIRQFKRDELPLLGLAGPEGPVLVPPNVQPTLDVQLQARQLFRQPLPGTTADQAFSALRLLGAQHQTLLGAEEYTRDACRGWWRMLAADTALNLPPCQPNSVPSRASHGHICQQQFTTRDLAASLIRTAHLITDIHQKAYADTLLEEEEAPDSEDEGSSHADSPEAADQHHRLVIEALQQQGLDAAIGVMAQHLKQQHPALFAPSPPFPSDQAPACNICQAAQRHDGTAAPELAAIQKYLYRDLRMRHEPIEWLYDGLAPLLPAAALRQRKGAPLTLALLVCMLCDRLGVAAVPLRATAPTAHVSPGQAALAGSAALMPDDLAARQAGRTASYLPSDSWLVAIVHYHTHQEQPQLGLSGVAGGPLEQQRQPQLGPAGMAAGLLAQQPQHVAAGGAGAGWRLSGVFLDVSVRGGAVLGQERLMARYPQALEAHLTQGAELVCVSGYLTLCADWVRALLVACQRRGESDLVAHWLVQLLALDPAAPEWTMMLTQQQQQHVPASRG